MILPPNDPAAFQHSTAFRRFIYHEPSGAMTVGSSLGQTSYTRPKPIAVLDPRGVTHRFYINSHDELVETSTAENVVSPNAPDFVAKGYWSRMTYDANGNLTELEVEDDSQSSPSVGTKYAWTHDILDQVRVAVEASGDLDLTTEYSYDAQLNLVERIRVGAGATPSARVNWYFDERGIVYEVIRGLGGTASITRNEIDANGNLSKWIDAEDSHPQAEREIQVVTDGFNRKVKMLARDGTDTRFLYDKVGNTRRETVRGTIKRLTGAGIGDPITASGVEVLSRVDYDYDERYRLIRTRTLHGTYSGLGPASAVPALDDGALSTTAGEIVHEWVPDRLGRIRYDVDGDADVTELEYDGLGRVRKSIDPIGNVTENAFDKNGNLTQVTERETWTLGGSFAPEVFTYSATYDALDRVVRVVEPNLQLTRFAYNSRGNLVRQTDQLGNEIDYTYDRATRLIETEQWLSASGQNATEASHSDVIRTEQEWDQLIHVGNRTDARGRVTGYVYDALERLIRTNFSDGSFERYLYSKDDELIAVITKAANARTYGYDPEGRRVRAVHRFQFGVGTKEVIGTTFQAWSYDGVGRLWSTADNNNNVSAGTAIAADDVLVTFGHDTLGRVIWEEQKIGTGPVYRADRFYQGESRLAGQVYPDGREVGRTYDGLDRLASVREGFIGAMGSRTLVTKDYVGQSRLLRQTYHRVLGSTPSQVATLSKLNTAGTSSMAALGGSYDTNGRTVKHRWDTFGGGSSLITEFLTTYNGAGGIGTNRRASETRSHPGLGTHDVYTFDSAYRMTGFDRMDGATMLASSTRVLDGTDKMTSFIDEGVNRMPVIDDGMNPPTGLNQYASIDSVARTYDDNGGLQSGLKVTQTDITTQTTVEKDVELRSDILDRAAMVRDDLGADLVGYAYDGIGRRVAKFDFSVSPTAPTVQAQYCYDGGWQVLEERDGSGSVTNQFVDGSGIDEHLHYRAFDSLGSPTDYFYHCNEQGFVGAITDDTGAVKERYEYKWLGEAMVLDANGVALADDPATLEDESRVGVLGNPYMFQGRRLDAETGLYHFRHRQYDPLTGSFVSVDPSGMWRHGQGNGYSAFDADPINFRDPRGLNPVLAGIIMATEAANRVEDWVNSVFCIYAFGPIVQGAGYGAFGVGYQGMRDYSSRKRYKAALDESKKGPGTREEKSARRDKVRSKFRNEKTSPIGKALLGRFRSTEEQAKMDAERAAGTRSTANPGKSNAAADKVARQWGRVGRGLGAVGAGITVVEICVSDKPLETAVEKGGGLAGAASGAWLLGPYGAGGGPWGVAGMSLVGGVLGGFAGEAGVSWAIDTVGSLFD